ncbi:MAG: CvpA family protein [Bacteroidales bacterium]|jgi:membrane protein required for colicin V production|nr:CvpA family protein [Bacteroidales bacterium]
MNYLDFIVIIPVLWGMFKGFKNGLIGEVGAVIALVLGIFLAMKFSAQGGELVAARTSVTPQYQEIVAFAIIFFIVVLLCFCVTFVLKRLFNAINLAWLDKLLGIVLGGVKWLIIVAFLFLFVKTITARYYEEPVEAFEKSLFFEPLAGGAHCVLEHKIHFSTFPHALSESTDENSEETHEE